MKISKLKKYIKHPSLIIVYLTGMMRLGWLSDPAYIKFRYRVNMGRRLNLDSPRAFNEKLQWLKLYDRKPAYTMMVDKYRVRAYIAKKLGPEYLVPLLGVWERAEDVDFDALPEQFVLKCNHNSGEGMCICRDKSRLDLEKVRRGLKKGLEQNYYLYGREWAYKDVPRRIIAEKFLEEKGKIGLPDYKLLVFGGKVKCSFVYTQRFSASGLHMTAFDRDWRMLPFERHYPKSTEPIEKPRNYERMVGFAEKLGKDLPFVRVDFLEAGGRLYFGELTIYPGNGLEEFTPEEWDYKLGEWLTLPE